MPWIRVIRPEEASSSLKRQYDAAQKRAGKIYNIVSISSLKPDFIRQSMSLYVALMKAPGKLSRAQREMIAVVVSKTNDCFY